MSRDRCHPPLLLLTRLQSLDKSKIIYITYIIFDLFSVLFIRQAVKYN